MTEETLTHHKRGLPPVKGALDAPWRKPAAAIGLRAEATHAELNPSTLASDLSNHPAEIGQHLLVAVEKAASKDAESMEALRVAVCSFTAALRDGGTTPERVLIVLKTIIHNETTLAIAAHPSDRRGKLREQISTWCIEEYFREKASP